VVHTTLSRPEIRQRLEEVIAAVGLEPHHLQRYPQRRRLALARTLVLNPRLIIFDEPTAGLDVSVQATILRFFRQVQRQFDLTYVFISHDLGIIRLMCDRVTVMYLGVIVESGPTPAHASNRRSRRSPPATWWRAISPTNRPRSPREHA
jgi:oligopeptide transport system ATP-binding protein